ncbi:hypothetical protein DERP_003831 [Dermatophagoides pteronyssinus]|uniref:Uncharacterized protein n=1 Tax=Dermatophagoides pteronyssinus TaxID=6956 RepID=A0ABQ8JMG8_DERPT|nr:hypothetical protein DERP_003831 [Dermatophagoides pteronyssinus]
MLFWVMFNCTIGYPYAQVVVKQTHNMVNGDSYGETYDRIDDDTSSGPRIQFIGIIGINSAHAGYFVQTGPYAQYRGGSQYGGGYPVQGQNVRCFQSKIDDKCITSDNQFDRKDEIASCKISHIIIARLIH